MSQTIRLTEEMTTKLLADIKKNLAQGRAHGKTLDLSIPMTKLNKKTSLTFTPKAYFKMTELVKYFDSEVAWHGVARKVKDGYQIDDILVYPQVVTGATVNTDQKKYDEWLYSHDDEVFNNIRMQGHSHVNMRTYPSAVDLEHRMKIVDQLEDDMFYIFIIWNKRDEFDIDIYDFGDNILYSTDDITVYIDDVGLDLESFLAEADEAIEIKAPKATGYKYQNYGGYHNVNGVDQY